VPQRDGRRPVAHGLGLLADAPEHQLDRQGRFLLGVRVEDPREQAAIDVGLEREAQRRRGLPGVPGAPGGGADGV
jgi:hypothetical protein